MTGFVPQTQHVNLIIVGQWETELLYKASPMKLFVPWLTNLGRGLGFGLRVQVSHALRWLESKIWLLHFLAAAFYDGLSPENGSHCILNLLHFGAWKYPEGRGAARVLDGEDELEVVPDEVDGQIREVGQAALRRHARLALVEALNRKLERAS